MTTRTMNVWRVEYDCVFRSSSGMTQYEKASRNQRAIVICEGNSIDAMRNALQATLDGQTEVTRLNRVEWVGEGVVQA